MFFYFQHIRRFVTSRFRCIFLTTSCFIFAFFIVENIETATNVLAPLVDHASIIISTIPKHTRELSYRLIHSNNASDSNLHIKHKEVSTYGVKTLSPAKSSQFISALTTASPIPITIRVRNKPKPQFSNINLVFNSSVKYSYNVYTFINHSWVRSENICEKMPTFPLVSLRTKYGKTAIAIHNPKLDIFVSGSIARRGAWEGGLINTLMLFLEQNKEAILLDVGANIGVYSLSAAKLGRKVVAVDPLPKNVKRLCTSFAVGNFLKQITIVTNPLSNKYANVNMGQAHKNVGGTWIIQSKPNQTLSGELYPTAKLDDLLVLPGFNAKDVVMKMDVETHESLLLKGSNSFFDKINVICVLMEWEFHRKTPDGLEIVEFFTKRRYKPFAPSNRHTPLVVGQRSKWPIDIIWIKQSL